MSRNPETATWSELIADFAVQCFRTEIPGDVLERAGLQLFDSLACAAGAWDAPPASAAYRAIAGSGPPEATLWFRGTKAGIGDAILANGTLVRYLDANDVYLGSEGPGGHPSDNIPVAVAFAEKGRSSGRDLLAAIAVQYELVWRLRTEIFRAVPDGRKWDAVSISSPVAAVTGALLLGADRTQVAHALSLAAVQAFVVPEVRGGEISMMKAAGNAVVARAGALAAMLAVEGMTGPAEAFEGRKGVVATLGGSPDQAMVDAVCAPPEWAIRAISVKPYPAFGTSQAVIHAARRLAAQHTFHAAEVARVTVRVPDSEWTRGRREVAGRAWPETRESADHSLTFLTAVALLHGDVTAEHYDRELWRDPTVRALMARTAVVPDGELTARSDSAFPGVVEVEHADGRSVQAEVAEPPGSPKDPYGWTEIAEKFVRLDRLGLGRSHISEVAAAIQDLRSAPRVDELASVVGVAATR